MTLSIGMLLAWTVIHRSYGLVWYNIRLNEAMMSATKIFFNLVITKIDSIDAKDIVHHLHPPMMELNC